MPNSDMKTLATLNTNYPNKKAKASNPTEIMHAGVGSQYAHSEVGTREVLARYIELTAPGQATFTLEDEEYYHSANVYRQVAFDACNLSDFVIDGGVIKHIHGKTVFDDGTPTKLDLHEVPPFVQPESQESDIVLHTPKGTLIVTEDGESERVVDRTIYPGSTTVTIVARTVSGKAFHYTGLHANVMRQVVKGDFYLYSPTQMCVVYGTQTQLGNLFPTPLLIEITQPQTA